MFELKYKGDGGFSTVTEEVDDDKLRDAARGNGGGKFRARILIWRLFGAAGIGGLIVAIGALSA